MAESAGARAFPAPGSAVPGAPPPLKRALTAADGVGGAIAEASGAVRGIPAVASTSAAVGASRFALAAALAGVAVGLELAGLLTRASSRSRPSKSLT